MYKLDQFGVTSVRNSAGSYYSAYQKTIFWGETREEAIAKALRAKWRAGR